MKFTVREARSAQELEKIIALRYEVLREPWGQPYESSRDELEEQSINACIEDGNEKVIACGRLQKNSDEIAQVRYMAVSAHYRGKGLGAALLDYLEGRAADLRVQKIQLQARDNAVAFYESRGYKIIEKSFLLWGEIQHYLMEKRI
jgi:N-acetylglutamate synthase-like GNAT family acetyltransferase